MEVWILYLKWFQGFSSHSRPFRFINSFTNELINHSLHTITTTTDTTPKNSIIFFVFFFFVLLWVRRIQYRHIFHTDSSFSAQLSDHKLNFYANLTWCNLLVKYGAHFFYIFFLFHLAFQTFKHHFLGNILQINSEICFLKLW